VTNPDLRIIPVVLGIAGFILGPMLGVFLIGMFTERRGSDLGNMIAISAGLLVTVVVGKLNILILNAVAPLFGISWTFEQPAAIPEVSFTWWAMIGALVSFLSASSSARRIRYWNPPPAMPRRLRPPKMLLSLCVNRG